MQGLRVLMAEENDLIASRLAGQPGALGHELLGVVRTRPGEAESIQKSPPDLVFLDLALSGNMS